MKIEQFIIKAKKIHNDRYDYSLVNYIDINNKINIVCNTHGVFKQTIHDHLRGHGCSKCSKNYRYNTNEIIEKFKIKHNDRYDYSLVNYINMETNVEIICKKHGKFVQLPCHHINGSNCPECIGVKKYTTETFIKKSNKIHNNKYNYTLVNYINNHTKVKIICPIHGEFEVIPKHHLKGVNCKLCNESKGEKEIMSILKKLNINYKREKTFKDCRSDSKCLQYDFYLIDLNICIEYDGIQHFKSIERFGGINGFIKRKKYDEIKNIYCIKNNIQLIRISYKENIEEKLKNLIF